MGFMYVRKEFVTPPHKVGGILMVSQSGCHAEPWSAADYYMHPQYVLHFQL